MRSQPLLLWMSRLSIEYCIDQMTLESSIKIWDTIGNDLKIFGRIVRIVAIVGY